MANEGAHVGTGRGVPDVEVDRGPGASLGFAVDMGGPCELPERSVLRPAKGLDNIRGGGACLGADVAEIQSTPDLQVARRVGEVDPRPLLSL